MAKKPVKKIPVKVGEFTFSISSPAKSPAQASFSELVILYMILKARDGDPIARLIMDSFGKVAADAEGKIMYPLENNPKENKK